MEQVDRDLRGGDGMLLDRDCHLWRGACCAQDHWRTTHGVAGVGQHREVVAARGYVCHGQRVGIDVAAQGLAVGVQCERVVALVEVQRELLVDGRRVGRIQRIGGVLLQQPAEAGDRGAGPVHDAQIKRGRLDPKRQGQGRHAKRIAGQGRRVLPPSRNSHVSTPTLALVQKSFPIPDHPLADGDGAPPLGKRPCGAANVVCCFALPARVPPIRKDGVHRRVRQLVGVATDERATRC